MNIQALKKVIQEAQPQKEWVVYEGDSFSSVKIELADVLIAIQANRNKNPKDWFAISPHGIFLENKVKEITPTPYSHQMISTGISWKLKENFDNQSPEVYLFLEKILL